MMNKMFATVTYTNGRNNKEKAANQWLRAEIDGTLLCGENAWHKLCRLCADKAARLDRQYPLSKPMAVAFTDGYGFPYYIDMGQSGHVTITEVKHEITDEEL